MGYSYWICRGSELARKTILAAAGVLAVTVGLSPLTTQAATFVVDDTGDASDANLANNLCQTAAGACTLRAAIEQANASSGADNIDFNIGGAAFHLISPGGPLPTITGTTNIDGTTDPSFFGTPIIVLNGAGAGGGAAGLTFATGSNGGSVSGLVVQGFGGSGLVIESNQNDITNCYFGTDVSAAAAVPNGMGILVSGDQNTIGGTSFNSGNRISGNSAEGIKIQSGSNNTIRFNLIGTNVDATSALGNGSYGVFITGGNDNLVGLLGQPNIISGNGNSAIGIFNGARNITRANFIGVDVLGGYAIANGQGIFVTDGTDNTIGGTTVGMGNLISGNLSTGITIGGGSGNKVQFNTLGTNPASTVAIPNQGTGIRVIDAPNTTIGPAATAGGNLVSSNFGSGIHVSGIASTDLVIGGNTVGTDVTATIKMPNGAYGVLMEDVSGALVGGDVTSEDNVIGGNTLDGVAVIRGSNNSIHLNELGIDGIGTFPVGNGGNGLYLEDSSNNEIKTNLIGDNAAAGIYIKGGGNNDIWQNIVGVDVHGLSAIPNVGDGIVLDNSSNNDIGFPVAGDGNTISGNNGNGVLIKGAGATGNVIRNTLVGLDITGAAPLGNGGSGIRLDGAGGNTIGGPSIDLSDTNKIAHNGADGITVIGGTQNSIRKNRIFNNGRLGIDIDGDWVTYNDTLDGDVGTNQRQNFPVVTSHTTTFMNGTLHSVPNTVYTVDVFRDISCDVSFHGQAEDYLGTTTTLTDGNGDGTFSIGYAPIGASDVVVAVAIDPVGNSSEMSRCNAAPAPDTLALFNTDLNLVSLIDTLQNQPPLQHYNDYIAGTPITGQWVMGDWDGDGQKTPAVYEATGAFYYTNDIGTTTNWTGRWIGMSGKAVAGRMDQDFVNDCIGIVEQQGTPPNDDYALHFTCNLDGPVAPGVSGQWLGRPLPDGGGFSGERQYAMGDYNNSGLQSIAVRRGPYVAFTNVDPGQTARNPLVAAVFDQAQFVGAPSGNDYGILVAGDWSDGIVSAQGGVASGRDSFGLFYGNGFFFYRNDLLWNSGQYTLQVVGQPIGTTSIHATSWRKIPQ